MLFLNRYEALGSQLTVKFLLHFCRENTVKLTRAKLPANAGKFTRGLHVKRPHTQFKCVKFRLLVKTGKFTRVYAASTSRRIHANCLQLHLNLPENSGYFTGILHADFMQIRPRLNCMMACFCKQKYMNCRQKPAIADKKYPELEVKRPEIAGKIPAIAGKNTRHCC